MKRVLIVDDAVTIRLFHRQLVEKVGCEVDEAENGVEALEKISAKTYDLFLVDVNMPKMDGYRLIQEIRNIPDVQHIPVIMISTEIMQKDKEIGYRAGCNLYVKKPVNPGIFCTQLTLLLDGCLS